MIALLYVLCTILHNTVFYVSMFTFSSALRSSPDIVMHYAFVRYFGPICMCVGLYVSVVIDGILVCRELGRDSEMCIGGACASRTH
jgi:hypothetical protein